MAARMAAVRSVTRIRFIIILEILLVSIPRLSRLLSTLNNSYAIGWLCHC